MVRGPSVLNRIFARLFPDARAFHMLNASPSPPDAEDGEVPGQLTFLRNSDFAAHVQVMEGVPVPAELVDLGVVGV
jgi:hypothetical protein